MYPRKLFVKESGVDPGYTKSPVPNVHNAFVGCEAQKFYDELIQGPSEVKNLSRGKSGNHHEVPKSKDSDGKKSEPKIYNIWKAAETDDIQSLSALISKEPTKLDAKDSFGWTPLMCAACSGAINCVRYLIKAGANRTEVASGYTALDLAKRNNHRTVIDLLTREHSDEKKITRRKMDEKFACELCRGTFSTNQVKHEASTCHLLTAGGSTSRTFYGIPESNKGFQILVRNGWDREYGLGPEGAGRKFPVKAKVKKSRSGVGAAEEKKKSDDSLKTVPRGSSRKRDRCFEREFRMEFS